MLDQESGASIPAVPTPVCLQAATQLLLPGSRARTASVLPTPGVRQGRGSITGNAAAGRDPAHPRGTQAMCNCQATLQLLPVCLQIHEAGVIPDPSGVYAAKLFPSLSLCLFFFSRGEKQSKASALKRRLVANFILQIRCKVPCTRHSKLNLNPRIPPATLLQQTGDSAKALFKLRLLIKWGKKN